MKPKRRDLLSEQFHAESRSTILPFISGMGVGAGIMYAFMKINRPAEVFGVAERSNRQAGGNRQDEVGHSGVYPTTGPFPSREAEVVPAGQFGGGSYAEHGTSTLTTNAGTRGEEAGGSTGATIGLSSLQAGEIPREDWLTFFNQLDKQIRNERVTIELRENGETHVAQRDMPIDGFGADVRARELIVNVGVGSTKDDLVIHSISAEHVRVSNEAGSRVLEIEGPDGRVVVVRFRSPDIHSQRVA